MSVTVDNVEADRALKARHREMWALGDYPLTAAQIIPELGMILVRHAGSVPVIASSTSLLVPGTQPSLPRWPARGSWPVT